jgi:hypothetical protein
MDAVARQLPDRSTVLLVGGQRLNLGRGDTQLDAAQLADIGNRPGSAAGIAMAFKLIEAA